MATFLSYALLFILQGFLEAARRVKEPFIAVYPSPWPLEALFCYHLDF